MIDYFKVDTQALFDIARCAEEQPLHLFNMGEWLEDIDCGTAGCLIGSWYLGNPKNCALKPIRVDCKGIFMFEVIAKRLGLSQNITGFLFGTHRLCIGRAQYFLESGGKKYTAYYNTHISKVTNATRLNKEQVLKRLRKVLYYILHKREVLGDYEKARRTGDIGIVNKVHESLEEVLV